MNPGRVTRSAIVLASWQSTQATGWAPAAVWKVRLVPPETGLADPVRTTSAWAWV
jgi:hypothetical protein